MSRAHAANQPPMEGKAYEQTNNNIAYDKSASRAQSEASPEALQQGWEKGMTRTSRHSFARLAFFFQAEDGIRDHCVTGVQTCALPIYRTQFRKNRGGPLAEVKR